MSATSKPPGRAKVGRRVLDRGFAEAAEIVYSHHERYDGTGCPRGLTGHQILLGARIVALANTWIPSRLTYLIARPIARGSA
jgi:response regulator RpfG family c-di-GMP phosphodiesterase